MVVLAHQLGELFQQFVGVLHPLPAVQAERLAVLHAHAGDQAQRAQRAACGIEDLRMAAGVAVDAVAAGGEQAQAGDIAGIRAEPRPGAVGRGGDRAGQALVVDVGHVDQRLADLLQRRAHLRHRRAGPELGLQGGRVVADQAAEPRQRHDAVVGRHQRAERMPGTDRAHRAACLAQPVAELRLAGRGETLRRQAVLRTRPIAPGDRAGGGGDAGHAAQQAGESGGTGQLEQFAAAQAHGVGSSRAMCAIRARNCSSSQSMHAPSGGIAL